MIQFFEIQDGERVEAGRALMEDDRVVFENVDGETVQELYDYGILFGGETYFPEDGEEFLNKLPEKYSGLRFRAEKVDE